MTQSEDFAKAIAFNWWPILAILKMLSFFEYYLSFRAVFCIKQLQCVVKTVLACFFAFLIFDPKWGLCKGYSLCLVAIFDDFQNPLIFLMLAFFWSRSLYRATAICCTNVVSISILILIFNFNFSKWGFCKPYTLCLVAIFATFQSPLIFRVLAVFSSRFLHRTTAMSCRNVFSMLFCFFNFWAKVGILESL